MTYNLPLAIPSLAVGSLENYITSVKNFPMLSHEEELELATRFQRDNDIEAARRLVLSHLRVVVSVARGYVGYGLPQADLIQEGNVGLMKAVKRYDPNRGVRLVSFALHWIRAEMHGDNLLRLKQAAGQCGFARTHGEQAANGYDSQLRVVELPDQLHVGEHVGVAGEVD